MENTQVTLTVVKNSGDTATGPGNQSTTTINANSLDELVRMLELAGIKNPGEVAATVTPVEEPIEAPVEAPVAEQADYDYGANPTSRKGYVVPVDPYAVKPNRPELRITNNSGDNALAEDELEEGYETLMKSFKDYLREAEEEKKEEVDEGYGMGWNAKNYDHVVALLPTQQMVSLADLENNEYIGNGLKDGQSGIVVMAIEANGKTRLTYASTYGGNIEQSYKPGETLLTYHDQRGNERPGKVLFAFSGKTYMDPHGRQEIAKKLEHVGMNAKKKYSLRVFK